MFSNSGMKIRKLTAIVLVIMSVCMMMSAQAETVAADTLFGEVKETYVNAFLGLGCILDGIIILMRRWKPSTRGRKRPCPMNWTSWLIGISPL